MFRGQKVAPESLSLPSTLFEAESLTLFVSAYTSMADFGGFSRLSHLTLERWAYSDYVWLYVSSVDLNSGPHACGTSPSPMEPSL